MVSALASGARGTENRSPQQVRLCLVFEHDSLLVICRDDMNTVNHPSDRDFNWRPLCAGIFTPVQVKEPYISNLNSYLYM